MNKDEKKKEFSKLLIAWELLVVSAVSAAGFVLAYLSIINGYTGSLPWITALVAPSWAAYGVSKAFFTDKAKAENQIKIPAYIERDNKPESKSADKI
jgi:hypothetical protein